MSSIPTTPAALKICELFKRRPNTPWTTKEIKQFKLLYKASCFKDEDEWLMIERYYKHERARGGYHRRDVATFLNHYPGELDRARAFCESHPIRSKGVRFTVVRKPVSDEEFEKNREACRKTWSDFKNKMRAPGSGT